MDLEPSKLQKQLQKAAREFLQKECPMTVIREVEEDDKGYSAELWRKMGDLGWLSTSMIFPKEYGGEEGSLLELAMLYEEMGRVLLPSPHLSSVVLSGLVLLNAGNEKQKADLLPKLEGGEQIFTLALTEPEYSWDAASISTRAVAEGDSFIINGTKMFIPYAHVADYILCAARTKDSGAPEENISLFIIDARHSTGLNCRRINGFLGEPLCQVTLNNVKVSSSNLLGKANNGWSYIDRAIRVGTVMQCCEMIGGAHAVLELTINYAKQRTQFGQFIGSFQRVQDRIINMLSDLDKTRLVTYEAAWRLSEGLPCDLEVSIAKALASEAYHNICEESHYVHAGIGFMKDYDLYLHTKKARTVKNNFGGPAFHRNIIAKEIALRA